MNPLQPENSRQMEMSMQKFVSAKSREVRAKKNIGISRNIMSTTNLRGTTIFVQTSLRVRNNNKTGHELNKNLEEIKLIGCDAVNLVDMSKNLNFFFVKCAKYQQAHSGHR